jgi:hypothetical protein
MNIKTDPSDKVYKKNKANKITNKIDEGIINISGLYNKIY